MELLSYSVQSYHISNVIHRLSTQEKASVEFKSSPEKESMKFIWKRGPAFDFFNRQCLNDFWILQPHTRVIIDSSIFDINAT